MVSIRPPAPPSHLAPLRALQALADENRLHVAETLAGGERCVCDLQATLGLSQSLLSHHLRVLREAGLVAGRREGKWVHYSLAPDGLEALGRYLGALGENARWAPPAASVCP